MTSIIRMTPISGGGGEEGQGPHCYLLNVDGFHILLDCGWDSKFSMKHMQELEKVAGKIDAILLSYPDQLHIGALPYLIGHFGINCPIYATMPVHKMGQMFLYDTYQSFQNVEDFSYYTLDEVDIAFEKINQLKYNQSVSLRGKGEGIVITPLPAGHMIGGTIWKIVKDGEEDIIYAVDYNHKKERHLNGCELDRISRPSLLITDALNATYQQPKRRQRDEQLMTNILSTLRSNGNVLVCVDTAGRVLELAYMVDQLWSNKDSGLLAYSLALLNNVSYNVVEFAKSQIEWMSEKLMKMMGERKANPFQFRHLKLCHSLAEVNKVPAPKVVLASMHDLESGFARDLFMNWCSIPKHSVIITSRCDEGTLGADLIANGGDRVISLDVKRRVKLTGAELEQHIKKEKEQSKKLHTSMVEEALNESSDSDEDDMDTSTSKPGVQVKVKHDIVMKPEVKKQTGFFKSNKSRYPMFPFREEKTKYDEYGELIRYEDFMDISEAPAPSMAEDESPPHPAIQEPEPETQEIPTKCVSTTQNFQIKCNVQYIDFEGRTDGESIFKLLTVMRPRRVILVRGSESSMTAMANFCKDFIGREGNSKVFMPKNGEEVDATTERFIYQVRLRDSLFSTLNFCKAKSSQEAWVAWIDGQVKMTEDIPDIVNDEGEGEAEKKMKESNQDKTEEVPILEPIQVDTENVESVVSTAHATSFVNEVKLSDFKLILTRNGIHSEFQQGNLTCGSNGNVLLRRHESGRVELEGCLSEDYYLIRTLLYQQYAIV